MILITDEKIKAANENYASVLDSLKNCISTNGTVIDEITLRTKAAIHYCEDIYNISFRKNTDDYYGNGIDLTARLMKKSEQSKIVLSETFYQLVKGVDASFLNDTSDILEDEFIGFAGKTQYRIMKI
jgi:class 3 adenylate cyclase